MEPGYPPPTNQPPPTSPPILWSPTLNFLGAEAPFSWSCTTPSEANDSLGVIVSVKTLLNVLFSLFCFLFTSLARPVACNSASACRVPCRLHRVVVENGATQKAPQLNSPGWPSAMRAATASADPRVVDGLRQLEEGVSGLATLPAAQRTEATMAAQARVASAVAVTAISARFQEPSGPVKAYQYRQPFSQPLARSTKKHKGSSLVRKCRGGSARRNYSGIQ